MKAVLEFLKKSAQSRRSSGPRPRRRITLLGPDRDSTVAVIHRVFGTVGRDSTPLQTDDQWKQRLDHPPAIPDEAPDDALRLSVLHLSLRRLGRPVPWELCIPASLNVREGAKASWRGQSDTIVVCWPSRLLGSAEESLGEIAMRLSGAIGKARALGRLRRVAFVIYDTPAAAGPRHPSQGRVDVPPDVPLRATLRVALERADRKPGDPLADPAWREYLSNGIQTDRPLADLVRMAGQAVGRDCPIFFVGDRPLPDALLPLVEWIRDDRAADRPAAGRSAKLLLAGAAAACLIALGALFLLPGPVRLDGPPSGLGAQALEREVTTRLAEYRGWFGVPEALAAGTSRPDLVRADRLLQNYRAIAGRGNTLRKFVADTIAGASALGDADRIARARLLRGRIALELRDWDEYRAKHPELQGGEWLQPWSTAIAQAIIHSAMLGATRRAGGFDGFRLLSAHDANLLQRLSGLGGSQEASAIAALAQTGSASEFYKRLDAARRTPNAALAASFRDAAPSAPRLRVDSLKFEADGAYRRSWVDLRRTFGRDTALFREFVIGSADHVRRIGEAALAPDAEMQILFQASADRAWHVDVKAPAMAEYLPALWVSPGGDGCVVLIHGHPDMQLRLSLKVGSRVHVLENGEAGGACSDSDRMTFRLERQEGDVRFPSGLRIHYRVISGWPGPQGVPS